MNPDSSSFAANRFESAWWSVELPAGWAHIPERECTTFYADPPVGTLQISAVRKDSGVVTVEDLFDFANDRLSNLKIPSLPKHVVFGQNTGISISYVTENARWREWWLRSNDLIIYVTYNVDIEVDDAVTQIEKDTIDHILCSLKSRSVRKTGSSDESL